MRSLERVNIRTNVRTYVRTHIHTYGTDPISPPQLCVVRGDNKNKEMKTQMFDHARIISIIENMHEAIVCTMFLVFVPDGGLTWPR